MNMENTEVLFILGITPRSGTHFLANLLCQHPDCTKSIVSEDALIAHSDKLSHYVRALVNSWNEQRPMEIPEQTNLTSLLYESIGEGLSHFLIKAKYQQNLRKKSSPAVNVTKKYIITKTPTVHNITQFYNYFPNSKLLIIIRDGRDVLESSVQSFNYDRETTIRRWVKGSQDIAQFQKQHIGKPFLIVKYEDLHLYTQTEMEKILSFLSLDVSKYDFQAALNLPVVGSSSFKRGSGNVHWLPVQKNESFDPLNRAAHWTRQDHESFNRLAKTALEQWGYQPVI